MECSVWKFKTESSISEVADFQRNPFRYFVRGNVKWKKLENLRDFSWVNWATNYNGDSTVFPPPFFVVRNSPVRPLKIQGSRLFHHQQPRLFESTDSEFFWGGYISRILHAEKNAVWQVATSLWQSHHGVRQTNCTRWRQGLWILVSWCHGKKTHSNVAISVTYPARWTFTKSNGKIHHAINGKIHYFDWAIFSSYVSSPVTYCSVHCTEDAENHWTHWKKTLSPWHNQHPRFNIWFQFGQNSPRQ